MKRLGIVVLLAALLAFGAVSCSKPQEAKPDKAKLLQKNPMAKNVQKKTGPKPKMKDPFEEKEVNTKKSTMKKVPGELFVVLDYLKKLNKQDRLRLGAVLASVPSAYIGKVRKLASQEALTIASMARNPLMSDDLRMLLASQVWRVIKGNLDSLINSSGYIYVDKRIPESDLNLPALILPMALIVDPAKAQRTAISQWQIINEWYFPITTSKFTSRLRAWFDPREKFVVEPNPAANSPLALSIVGLDDPNGHMPALQILNESDSSVFLPVLNLKLKKDAPLSERIGKSGLYRQMAWIVKDKNGDVLGYSRPYMITNPPKSPDELELTNLTELSNSGKPITLMLVNQRQLFGYIGNARLIAKYGPLELTVCMAAELEPAQVLKFFGKKLDKKPKAEQMFSGYVCTMPYQIKQPVKLPRDLKSIPQFETRSLSEMLSLDAK